MDSNGAREELIGHKIRNIERFIFCKYFKNRSKDESAKEVPY